MGLKVKDVLANSTGNEIMRSHLCKSYLQLALKAFCKTHGHYPKDISSAQEIYDLYENQWIDHYIYRPAREQENRKNGMPIWHYGCSIKVDVYSVMCRFIEYKFADWVDCPDRSYSKQWYNAGLGRYGYYKNSCGDIMKEKKIEFLETFIIEQGLLTEWKDFAYKVRKEYPHYRRTYQDFSHLAYNNVTDDF